MDEIINSIKAFLYDRVASPLFGSFVVAWLVWNYKVILVVFSGLSADTKIESIEKYLNTTSHFIPELIYTTFGNHLTNSFVLPLFLALFYIFISPFVSMPVYRFSLKMRTEMINLKKSFDSNHLLSQEESRKIHLKLALLEEEHAAEVSELNQKISAMAAELEKKGVSSESVNDEASMTAKERFQQEAEVNNMPSEESERHRLSKQENLIMEAFSKGVETFTLDQFCERHKDINRHILTEAAGSLAQKGYISMSPQKRLRIQSKGRKYIIENFLNKPTD